MRCEPFERDSPESWSEVAASVDFITGIRPRPHTRLGNLSEPLVEEFTECFSIRVGVRTVFKLVQDVS